RSRTPVVLLPFWPYAGTWSAISGRYGFAPAGVVAGGCGRAPIPEPTAGFAVPATAARTEPRSAWDMAPRTKLTRARTIAADAAVAPTTRAPTTGTAPEQPVFGSPPS